MTASSSTSISVDPWPSSSPTSDDVLTHRIVAHQSILVVDAEDPSHSTSDDAADREPVATKTQHPHPANDKDDDDDEEEEEEEEEEDDREQMIGDPVKLRILATLKDLPSVATTDSDDQLPRDKPITKQRVNKILFLDGLRGLAVLLVVLHHGYYTGYLNSGGWGVDIFFVLSSFLLTMIFDKKAHQLVKNAANVWQWCIALVDYFQRRFLRVYPLFALVAVMLMLLSQEQRKNYYFVGESPPYDLWKVLTFTPDYRYFVFWTLPVEIGYYFVIPVFVVAMMVLGEKWWIAVGPVYLWVIYTTGYSYRASFMFLADFLPTFVAGSMSAIVYLRLEERIQRNHFEFNKWHRLGLRVVEYITFLFLLSTCFKGILFDWLVANPFPENGGDRFISLHICILIVVEMLSPSEFSKCLEWHVLRSWGQVGFSMYLLHPFVVYNNWVFYQETLNRFVLQLGLSFVVASVSYRLIEVPLQRIAGKISRFLARKSHLYRPYQQAPTVVTL